MQWLGHLMCVGWIMCCCAMAVQAENWPQWRGTLHDGISHETNLPVKFSKTENCVWSVKLPGAAGASPVVWGEHIFLTAAVEKDLQLLAYSTAGKQLWVKTIGSGNQIARGDEGNYASPSPVTDGEHVWAFVGTGDFVCYDFSGKEVWHRNLQTDYGRFEIQFGMSSTPVLDGNNLYLQLIHGEGDPATREALVICLDKTTGKQVWKQPRPSEAEAENEHSYASPTLYRDNERAFLLTHGADYIIAHDLNSGAELWRVGGLNPKDKYNKTLRLVASPLAVPGLIVAPSAKNGPVLGIHPQGIGTDIRAELAWTRKDNTPDVPSPLYYKGVVYLCRENGTLLALDAKSGEQLFQERCYSDRYRASPILADGHLYLTSRKGIVTVVNATRTFESLAENDLGEDISASPAVSNGRIYFRTFKSLIAIGFK